MYLYEWSFTFNYCRYVRFCTIARKLGSGRPTKITSHVQQIVEQRMCQDDETTATRLYEVLIHYGIAISLRTQFYVVMNN